MLGANRTRAQQRRRLDLHVRALSHELRRSAEEWRAAREEHGELFPEWTHEDIARELADCQRDVSRGNDGLESTVEDLAERVVEARREYDRHSKLSLVGSSLEAALHSRADDSRAEEQAATAEQARSSEEELRRRAEQVSRLLDTLSAEASATDRRAIEKRAEGAMEPSSAARRKALLAQLRLEIQRANAAAIVRQRTVAQTRLWREQLIGLDGPEVDALDSDFNRAADGETALPAGIGQRVDEVVAKTGSSMFGPRETPPDEPSVAGPTASESPPARGSVEEAAASQPTASGASSEAQLPDRPQTTGPQA